MVGMLICISTLGVCQYKTVDITVGLLKGDSILWGPTVEKVIAVEFTNSVIKVNDKKNSVYTVDVSSFVKTSDRNKETCKWRGRDQNGRVLIVKLIAYTVYPYLIELYIEYPKDYIICYTITDEENE